VEEILDTRIHRRWLYSLLLHSSYPRCLDERITTVAMNLTGSMTVLTTIVASNHSKCVKREARQHCYENIDEL